jgi:hypothetical protein
MNTITSDKIRIRIKNTRSETRPRSVSCSEDFAGISVSALQAQEWWDYNH